MTVSSLDSFLSLQLPFASFVLDSSPGGSLGFGILICKIGRITEHTKYKLFSWRVTVASKTVPDSQSWIFFCAIATKGTTHPHPCPGNWLEDFFLRENNGKKPTTWIFPWWSSGKESTCQCRGQRFNAWSRKIPHGAGQLSLCATMTEPTLQSPWAATTEPMCLEPVLHNKGSPSTAKPMHCS